MPRAALLFLLFLLTLYQPSPTIHRKRGCGRNVAVLASFAISALAHEALMFFGTGDLTMEWFTFFIVAALLLFVEEGVRLACVCVCALQMRCPGLTTARIVPQVAQKGGMGRFLTLATLSVAAEFFLWPPPLRAGLDDQIFNQFLRAFRLI
jgi:hypothetical protein